MSVSVSYYDNISETELMKTQNIGFPQLSSSENNKQLKDGSSVILVNKESKKVFGIARLSGPSRKSNLIDSRNIYSVSKYNKYEIPCKSVYILPKHLNYSDVNELIGVDGKIQTSISHYQHLSKGGIREFNVWKSENKESIRNRLLIWISTLPLF